MVCGSAYARGGSQKKVRVTYNIANFLGFNDSTGKSAKQMTKHASAARLHPPKIRRRSHRLTARIVCQHGDGMDSRTTERVCTERGRANLRANQPSSSSLLLGAGSGAPGASWVGNETYPPLPKGFIEESFDRNGVDEFVVAGMSASLRDQPKEFIWSLNDDEAILTICL